MERLKENLEYLMQKTGLKSQQALHRASGVSQAHIGNILRCEKSPGLYILVDLAKTFSIKPWQLLAPLHILKLGVTPELSTLIDCYARSDDEGQHTILRVAESQAKYSPHE